MGDDTGADANRTGFAGSVYERDGYPVALSGHFIFFLKEHGFAQINMVYDGNNSITIDNPDKLRPGTYILQMLNDGDPQ